MKPISIEIHDSIKSRNSLDKAHWSVRHHYTLKWESLIYYAFKCRPPKAKGKVMVKIKSFRTGTLDHDNLVGGCKGILDAMKRLGLIIDDTPDLVHVDYEQKRVKREERKTVIELKGVV